MAHGAPPRQTAVPARGSRGDRARAAPGPPGNSSEPQAPRIRLFLADHYPMFIAGMATELARQKELIMVGSALTWEEATRQIGEVDPDLALIEDSLAGSCAAAVAALAAPGGTPRVVFLSDSVETASVYEAMAVGAAGYVTREMDPALVVRALHDAFEGRPALSPELQGKLAEQIRLHVTAEAAAVSEREHRTLQLIADGAPTRDIARELGVSAATVKSDVGSILVKLGVHDRAAAVAAAFRKGLIE